MKSSPLLSLALAAATAIAFAAPSEGAIDLTRIRLAPGFKIEMYADGVKGARSMALGPDGTVYVGTRSEGKVYAIPNRDRDGRGDSVITIAQELDSPNGVALKDGTLYIAENSRIVKIDDVASRLGSPRSPVLVTSALPSERHHGWKFLRVGPDGKLYVPVGAPCDTCERPEEPKFASILRLNTDGTGMEVFASGIRNTVGYDWHPSTGELWFTDNGRDMLGDDIPSDELNRAPQAGMHFGYPYCHAGTIADRGFGANHPCSNYVPPERKLDAHVAALGMRFYAGSMFPASYRNSIFIAEHGSWNRSTPVGYRVMQVKPGATPSSPMSYTVFAEGWLQTGQVLGRPVDVQGMPDGSLLVSDDYAGAIYRISYSGGAASRSSPRPTRRPAPRPTSRR